MKSSPFLHPDRRSALRLATTAVLMGGLTGAAPTLGAQVNLPPVAGRDTITSDLLDAFLDAPGWRQSLTIRGTVRRYAVNEVARADNDVREEAGFVAYDLRGPKLRLRLDFTPVRYRAIPAAGTGGRVEGLLPANARLEWRWRDGDTTRLYVRTGSRPAALDSAQSLAIGTAGTSTLDLEALAFGAQPVYGVRQTFAMPLDGPWTFGVRGALETSPVPGGTEFTYWTGTTWRAGAALTAQFDNGGLFAVGADVSRSSADSLGGRNLFPGGGATWLEGRGDVPLDGETGRVFLNALAFYSAPFANPNADQVNRLIPQGNFGGVTLGLTVDGGRVFGGPFVSYLRESSEADARRGGALFRADILSRGTGYASAVGASVAVKVVRGLELSVDGALTRGGTTLLQRYRISRVGRPPAGTEIRRETDIVGGWLAAELTVRF
jgi:hypothetical protein